MARCRLEKTKSVAYESDSPYTGIREQHVDGSGGNFWLSHDR